MELKILNSELELIGVIDAFNSLVWTSLYSGGGSFEMKLPFTQENILLIKRENIVVKDSEEAGYIETLEIAMDSEGIENIVCRGKLLANYLNRRIVWGYESLNGNIETEMRKIVNNNFIIAPAERIFPKMQLGEINNVVGNIKKAISFDNVFEVLEDISKNNNVIFKIKLDYINRKLNFLVYNVSNRTINQSILPRVVFSRDFENILEQNYIDSINNYKNVALVAGAGTGALRKRYTSGFSVGLNRLELFVDAKDINDKRTVSVATDGKDPNGNTIYEDIEETIPMLEYNEMLKTRGNEKLSEYKEIKTFDSVINTKSESSIYKIDYFLGDIVTVVDNNWGLTIDTQITEVQEIYEKEGIKINVTFGNNIPTLIEKIKSMR